MSTSGATVPGAAAAQRTAGSALLVLGVLNVVGGALLAAAGAAPVGTLVLLAGVLLTGLGVMVRRGSRPAAVAATVLLAVLAVLQVVGLFSSPDGASLVRLLLTAVLLWLVVRALRA